MICDRDFFKPFDQRVWKEAITLKNTGYDIHIITPHSNSYTKEIDGLVVHCVSKSNIPGVTALKILNCALKGNYDLFHCHEIDPLLYSIILKLLTGKKIIWDCHEDYPSLISTKIRLNGDVTSKPGLEWLISLIIRIGLLNISAIITVVPPLVKRYKRIKPTFLIPNFPKSELFNQKCYSNDVKNIYLNRKVIVYQGGIKAGRGLGKLLLAVEIIIQKIPNVLFVVVGGEIEDSGWNNQVKTFLNKNKNNLLITGWVEHANVAPYLVHADVGVVLNRATHYNNLIGLPNKLYEYMACGLPVVASNMPQMANVIKKHECGISVDPENETHIAEAILKILSNQKIYNEKKKKELNWEMCEKSLKKIYLELLKK